MLVCLQSRGRGASIDREAIEEAGAASARQIFLTTLGCGNRYGFGHRPFSPSVEPKAEDSGEQGEGNAYPSPLPREKEDR